MNESVGNALLFNLVISIVIILLAFFVGSISYSKASKVKNKIVEELEKQGEIDSANTLMSAEAIYNAANGQILNWLNDSNIGYRQNIEPGTASTGFCPNLNDNGQLMNITSDYEYCIYAYSTCNPNTNTNSEETDNNQRCGIYFKVRTYMYFDIPVIEDLVKIPVEGETITLTNMRT